MVTPSATVTPGPKKTFGSIVTSRPSLVSWLKHDRLRRDQRDAGEHRRRGARRSWKTRSTAASSARVLTPSTSSASRLDRRDLLARARWRSRRCRSGSIRPWHCRCRSSSSSGRAAAPREGHQPGIAEADRALVRASRPSPRGSRRAGRPPRSAGHSRSDRPGGSRARRRRPPWRARSRSALQRLGRDQRRVAVEDEHIVEAGGELLPARQAPHAPCRAAPRCSWMAASGATLGDEGRATASASGPTTTAIRVAPAASAAASTWPSIGSPPTGCITFGMADLMRVPSPAARMIGKAGSLRHGGSPSAGSHRPAIMPEIAVIRWPGGPWLAELRQRREKARAASRRTS